MNAMPYHLVWRQLDIECDTVEEAVRLSLLIKKQADEERNKRSLEKAMKRDREWLWPMHQPVFV